MVETDIEMPDVNNNLKRKLNEQNSQVRFLTIVEYTHFINIFNISLQSYPVLNKMVTFVIVVIMMIITITTITITIIIIIIIIIIITD